MREKQKLGAEKKASEFTKDQEVFIKDLSDCRELLRSAFRVEKVEPGIVFALFEATGGPEDLTPSEREQLGEELGKSANLAREVFGDAATTESFFKVYYIFTAELDDEDIEPEEAFLLSATMAKKVFGEDTGPNEVLEVFDRFFVVDPDDDEDDDDDEE